MIQKVGVEHADVHKKVGKKGKINFYKSSV